MTTINSQGKPRIPESLLSQIWKGQWIQKGPLPASDGRMVQVRSAGMENKDSGPDFLGSTILLDDEIITGDIELHVKSSDWRAHGHHRDPHFNSVILQVVLWNDARNPALLHNGATIPTLPLHNYLNGSLDELSVRAEARSASSLPCHGARDRLNEGEFGRILDTLGKERFYVKSAFFEMAQILEEPEQILYQGIMGALGYTKNKRAFQELARHLPLRVLESIARESEPQNRILTLQSLLLGAAGLLPSQSEGKSRLANLETLPRLEKIWSSLNIENHMNYADWHFFRMHPNNSPTKRLLAAGCLVDRYMDEGLLNGVFIHVKSARPSRSVTTIESGFMISDLLGQGRAREIVVNVVFPFCLAQAETNSDYKFREHILQLYSAYPRLSENQITRYLNDLFEGKRKSKIAGSAQRQQGLVHLYKTFCQEHRCEVCPISTELHEG
ncbi:MAG: DUF2851 family protein [Chloroflexota bacterium]|nr:DUF2851 family protein [Chloroflexota bacterium]